MFIVIPMLMQVPVRQATCFMKLVQELPIFQRDIHIYRIVVVFMGIFLRKNNECSYCQEVDEYNL
ncbi:hypothetical protein BJB45_20810 [Halomonas huangheensis]|uniref:Uncharacterized protein n=1 Tax=Halomonas huangheensis TaxID=1178482 RepID=W1N772_9GAMM|nr:hypothetical protein BJB45_20810 [Halomonas huangheensis]